MQLPNLLRLDTSTSSRPLQTLLCSLDWPESLLEAGEQGLFTYPSINPTRIFKPQDEQLKYAAAAIPHTIQLSTYKPEKPRACFVFQAPYQNKGNVAVHLFGTSCHLCSLLFSTNSNTACLRRRSLPRESSSSEYRRQAACNQCDMGQGRAAATFPYRYI